MRTRNKTSVSTAAGALLCAAVCGALVLAGCGDFVERTYVLGDFVLVFNAQGGTVAGGNKQTSLKLSFGSHVALPAPHLAGYKFLGWYSEPETGGEFYGMNGVVYEMEAKDVVMHARWESHLDLDDGDSMINGIVCVLVDIGSGTFTMGSPTSEPDRYYDETQRVVTLTKSFWISKYPITNRQFMEYRALFPDKSFPAGSEEHPVVNVSWYDAMKFAAAAGGDLPTEAQWEFAARGGNAGRYNRFVYSGGSDPHEVAWFARSYTGGTAPKVGQKAPNELGIYDMSGNVNEWVYDLYGYFDYSPATDPKGPESGEGRVHRGGGWNSEARDCRVADRAYSNPDTKRNDIGFRVMFYAEE